LRAEARDDKAAEQLRDVVRGGLAAGKLVSGDNPKTNAMLNSLQITGSGKTVGVTLQRAGGSARRAERRRCRASTDDGADQEIDTVRRVELNHQRTTTGNCTSVSFSC
jgi:hypothetical protein